MDEEQRSWDRDKDLQAHAQAIRKCKEFPGPKNEAALDRKLEGAGVNGAPAGALARICVGRDRTVRRGRVGVGDDIARTASATKARQLAGEAWKASKKGPKAFKYYKKVDSDLDGFVGSDDNCPFVHNRDQADSDGDGFGEACDSAEDADLDSVVDAIDNCRFVSNESQVDFDEDSMGDACDFDMDEDGLANTSDRDMDGDGYQSTNDRDNDGDGITNDTDRFDWDPAY